LLIIETNRHVTQDTCNLSRYFMFFFSPIYFQYKLRQSAEAL